MGKPCGNWTQMSNSLQYSQQSQNIFEKSIHGSSSMRISLTPVTQNFPSNTSNVPGPPLANSGFLRVPEVAGVPSVPELPRIPGNGIAPFLLNGPPIGIAKQYQNYR